MPLLRVTCRRGALTEAQKARLAHAYDRKDEKTLVMTYNSPRDLIEPFDGAVRGGAIRFGESIETTILDRERVEIRLEA